MDGDKIRVQSVSNYKLTREAPVPNSSRSVELLFCRESLIASGLHQPLRAAPPHAQWPGASLTLGVAPPRPARNRAPRCSYFHQGP